MEEGTPAPGAEIVLEDDPDLPGDLGPAMAALTPKQRAFVRIYVETPTISSAQAARLAGYSDTGDGAKVIAFRLLHSERVLKAVNEELDKRFRAGAVIGMQTLLEVAQDRTHPHRVRAAEALLNRGGFHALSEQRIKVEHTDMSPEVMVERIRHLAHQLGMDPAQLLGANGPLLLIDGSESKPKPN